MLLIADVFEDFLSKCFETHELNPAIPFLAPGLARQTYLKKD